jgi:hypothetical protein
MTDLVKHSVSLDIRIVFVKLADREEDPITLRIVSPQGMIGREDLACQTDFGGSDRHDRDKNSPNSAPKKPHATISSQGPSTLHASRANVIPEASADLAIAMTV